jgi:thioredoxin 1
LILDCANTPRHPNVKRVPTLLIYQNGNLMKTFEGISDRTLLQAFGGHA